MFNEQLHRRLDGEEPREICLQVLDSFYRELHQLIESKGWEEDDGLREILAVGLRAIRGWKTTDKPLDAMSPEEKLRFLQDRASSLDAAYSTMKFQAYQVMRENDALDMNLRGLMPRLEGTTQRVQDLEEEVHRLRKLVPEEHHKGNVLLLEPQAPEPEEKTIGDKIRGIFKKDPS